MLRAFRFTLDPTSAQEEVLLRHVGAARGRVQPRARHEGGRAPAVAAAGPGPRRHRHHRGSGKSVRVLDLTP
ncbi:helix-turn-helix domain-containing protein [Streptomyces sp. MMS24-I29]|uniref:helix-turn-helix domain-containing protein n=1 Tax=Streptomyces sp. MMS24-I29 TaxID=3351480 RepID=UPI003C7C639D